MNVVLLLGSPSVPSRSSLLLAHVTQRLEEPRPRGHPAFAALEARVLQRVLAQPDEPVIPDHPPLRAAGLRWAI